MSELTDNVAPAIEPDVEPDSALPSDVDANSFKKESWEFTDEFRTDRFKNGKLDGRFDSMDAVLNTLKAVETKHANYVRDTKDGARATEAEIEQSRVDSEKAVATEQSLGELTAELIGNGMNMTAEIKTKLEESGISQDRLEVSAYKSRDAIGKAYDSVGGKEEYDAMASWAKENLSDSQRLDFDKGLSSSSADIYISGLHAMYKKSGSTTEPTADSQQERVTGSTSQSTVGGYANRAELFRDKRHVDGGRATEADVKAFQAKMARTPDSVIYGR